MRDQRRPHPLHRTVLGACALVASLLGTSACTSVSVTGVIEDEPVCSDFVLGSGGTKMKGSLKQPVKVAILEDQEDELDDALWARILLGRREGDGLSKFRVADDDETYVVRWMQCPNIFAPKPVGVSKMVEGPGASGYACGEAETYAHTTLEIKEGDEASRVIKWSAPPSPSCWEDGKAAPGKDDGEGGAGGEGGKDGKDGKGGAEPSSDGGGGAGGKGSGDGGQGGKDAKKDEPDGKDATAPAPTATSTAKAPGKAPKAPAPAKTPTPPAPAKPPAPAAPAPAPAPAGDEAG